MPPRHSLNTESFYERVYAFVRRVPPGTVVTYGQVALELGAPAAARAVGYALHFLPKSGVETVPWWRVINARGSISLKGRGPEADRQRAILEQEGIPFDSAGHVDLNRYRWWPPETPGRW
ncbi:MAG: MGMT family protein [Dehalococcoidia bacterium]|nr:MGMT family protein [Dehalococcoidia bacterium]